MQGNMLREGDVYLIVEPVMSDAPSPMDDKFTPHIHQTFTSRFEVYYWIGKVPRSRNRRSGPPRAVELAQVLAGRTKLHREVQGEESTFIFVLSLLFLP